MKNKDLKIGFNINASRVLAGRPEYKIPVEEGGGVDFIVLHHDTIRTPVKELCEQAKTYTAEFAEKGIEFVSNHEDINFNYDCMGPDGFDWANGNGDGTHRLKLHPDYVKALNGQGNCLGIMYDEFEHVIVNRNYSIYMDSKFKKDRDIPVFLNAVGKDPVTQGELLGKQLKEYADEVKALGAERLMGEHVFPVLFHTFARNGITPNFKSQKESISNVQFAIAAGAALQYGTELWNCVDCWYRLTNPGHSAEEMYNNLVFAYHAGVNRVYVESASVFAENEKANAYGRAFCRFTEEFRGRDRAYDVSDYRPEIGVIRYDDTFWGQGHTKHFWRNMLFGNPLIKASPESKEYIAVFDLITHGATGKRSISWGAVEPHSLTKHRSFAAMNGAAVFDDRVEKETLASLKLCFLCGCHISGKTKKAVAELVRENGLTVVTPTRFAPLYVSMKVTKNRNEIKDGKGTWIVTDDLTSSKLRKRLSPFLGKKDEIRLTFGDRTVTMKVAKDGNSIKVVD